MITVDALTKIIISLRDDISNKKLQKLAYYVYAWHLTIYNEPIAALSFEAWEHGPVSRKIYNSYRKYGWNMIPRYRGFILADDECIRFVESVVEYYGELSADDLEKLTHSETPWIKARQGCAPNEASDTIISDYDMINCYSNQLNVRKIIEDKMKLLFA